MQKIAYNIGMWWKRRKIIVYDNPEYLFSEEGKVYDYTVFWFEDYGPLGGKRTSFASKKRAIAFAIEHYKNKLPPPFIIRSKVGRGCFREDVEVKYVRSKHGSSRKTSSK